VIRARRSSLGCRKEVESTPIPSRYQTGEKAGWVDDVQVLMRIIHHPHLMKFCRTYIVSASDAAFFELGWGKRMF